MMLAHVSDPHVGPVGNVGEAAVHGARGLTLKQRLALSNWHRRRRHLLRAEIAAATAADIIAAAPDHIAVTGDLANAGLPAEFDGAAAWLEALDPGFRDAETAKLSIIPGNHDAMACGTWEVGAARLGLEKQSYPWCRRLGPIALIGLSSAVPTLPLLATGRLGAEQIDTAAKLLATAGAEGLCRVVLVHHPPGETTLWRRALTDREAFGRMLSEVGAELVLYGHNHRSEETRIGAAQILALGAPSASAVPGPRLEPAGWFGIEISGQPGAWEANVTLRRLSQGGRFETVWTRTHSL